MSRWLPTAALLAALALPCLAGCGSAPSSGKGTHPAGGAGSAGQPGESGKDTAKTTAKHPHDPG
jgi:hypothetical protein